MAVRSDIRVSEGPRKFYGNCQVCTWTEVKNDPAEKVFLIDIGNMQFRLCATHVSDLQEKLERKSK